MFAGLACSFVCRLSKGPERRFIIRVWHLVMERRANPGKPVLISGTIAFSGDIINCVVSNMSISGAALDVISPVIDIPKNSRWYSRQMA
jgi:hypothetical protein